MKKLKVLIAASLLVSSSYCIAEEDDCDGSDSKPCYEATEEHGPGNTTIDTYALDNAQQCTSGNDNWGPCDFLDTITCHLKVMITENDGSAHFDYPTLGPVDEHYCNG